MKQSTSAFPLRPGSECILLGLGNAAPVARRLAQMGLVPGSRLRVVRLAPFGDTVEISVDGAQGIALRAEDLHTLDCKLVALPLSLASRRWGRRYRLRSLSGGRTFRERMGGLGIVPGVELVVSAPEVRPLRVDILPMRKTCVLGEGQAQKLIVEPLDDPNG